LNTKLTDPNTQSTSCTAVSLDLNKCTMLVLSITFESPIPSYNVTFTLVIMEVLTEKYTRPTNMLVPWPIYPTALMLLCSLINHVYSNAELHIAIIPYWPVSNTAYMPTNHYCIWCSQRLINTSVTTYKSTIIIIIAS
jgi:hypothetical protein